MAADALPVFGMSRLRMATDGAGVTTLVGAWGCPLRCPLCINPHAWRPDTKCTRYTPDQLMEKLAPDGLYFAATNGGVTFGGGEPLIHAGFIRAFAQRRPKSWRINVETALGVPLGGAPDCIDGFIVDVKDMNPSIYRRYTGAPIDTMLENLKLLARYPNRVKARVPLIPGYNTPADCDQSENALRAMGFTDIERFCYIVP